MWICSSLPQLLDCHRAKHGVRPPICSRSCLPGGIQDFQQLLLFEVKVKLGVVGNLETLRQPQPDRLFREPVNENPSKYCSRDKVTFVRKRVETERTAA